MSSDGISPETKAVLGGGAVIIFGAVGRWANGYVYSMAEAKQRIEALTDSALYLGSAMTGGSATVLALMLTLVGLIRRMDDAFDRAVYRRIAQVGLLSAWSLAGPVALLLVLTMPVGEFEKMPGGWYPALYNVLYGMVVALSALLVGTVVLLYQTVRVLINTITPDMEEDV